MDAIKLIPITRMQLRQAADVLGGEMKKFAGQKTVLPAMEYEEDTAGFYDYGGDEDGYDYPDQVVKEKVESWEKLKEQVNQEPIEWARTDNWENFNTYWANVEDSIRAKTPDRLHVQLDEANLLRQTVGELAKEFDIAFNEAAEQSKQPLDVLARRAELLRNYSEMWTVYQTAWEQRYATGYLYWNPADEPDSPLWELFFLGDSLVRSFANVVHREGLDLVIPNQKLIVVPNPNRMFLSATNMPLLYVAVPRFGHKQIWPFLGYAHEAGHFVLRNVNGLSAELVVNIMMNLGGEEQKVQSIWYRWIEEIFADIYGLLVIGPGFASSQQRILLLLEPQVNERLGKNTDVRVGLLHASDKTHPPPHLRAHLTFDALRLISPQAAEKTERLQTNWDDLFLEKRDVDTSKIFLFTPDGIEEFSFEDMHKIGQTVLKVMLETPLFALGKKPTAREPNPSPKRSLKEVFHSPVVERTMSIRSTGGAQKPQSFQDLLTTAQNGLEWVAEHLTDDGLVRETSGLKPANSVIDEIREWLVERLKKQAIEEAKIRQRPETEILAK